MRVLAVVLALGAVSAAAPVFAQAPAPTPQGKPAAPGPAAPAPQSKTPSDALQPGPAKPVQLPPPFQDGFKYGFIRMQLVASESSEGKNATAEINALREKLGKQLNQKNEELVASQKTLESQGGVLSDQKRVQLEAEIERSQRDIERMAEDADRDVQRLTDRLQQQFMQKLTPIIDRLAKEKKVDMIFNAQESGLVWAAQGMDLTTDVIQALDGGAAAKPAASAPASAPSAPATTPPPATTK